jgi:hypothetical protein
MTKCGAKALLTFAHERAAEKQRQRQWQRHQGAMGKEVLRVQTAM